MQVNGEFHAPGTLSQDRRLGGPKGLCGRYGEEKNLVPPLPPCLLNVFAATLHIWWLFSSIRNARTRRAMVIKGPISMDSSGS
jgi:hypothetical protein